MRPVDLVTGPGNVYVVAAKRLLEGLIGIDSEAGPTEIAVLADETADPVHVAADLVSQAEHDPLAASVLVTDTRSSPSGRGRARAAGGDDQARERVRTALGGQQSGIVLVDDLDAGLAVVDAYAAEHLEIQTADAAELARRVTNAAPSSSGRTRRCRWATTAPGPTTCCPPAAAPATPAGCRCSRSCAASTSSSTTGARCRRSPATWSPLADAEDLPGHGDAVRARFRGAVEGPRGVGERPGTGRR